MPSDFPLGGGNPLGGAPTSETGALEMYAKMKELGPIRRGHWRRPWIRHCSLSAVHRVLYPLTAASGGFLVEFTVYYTFCVSLTLYSNLKPLVYNRQG